MNAVLIVVVVVLAATAAALALALRRTQPRSRRPVPEPGTGRILFPFIASALSCRALDASLRLARAEDATLLPVFLARVPLTLPLDSPLPRQAAIAIPLQEAIEQRAAVFGVPIDGAGGARAHLSPRAAPDDRQRALRADRDRRAADGVPASGPDDVAWLLAHASGRSSSCGPAPRISSSRRPRGCAWHGQAPARHGRCATRRRGHWSPTGSRQLSAAIALIVQLERQRGDDDVGAGFKTAPAGARAGCGGSRDGALRGTISAIRTVTTASVSSIEAT